MRKFSTVFHEKSVWWLTHYFLTIEYNDIITEIPFTVTLNDYKKTKIEIINATLEEHNLPLLTKDEIFYMYLTEGN